MDEDNYDNRNNDYNEDNDNIENKTSDQSDGVMRRHHMTLKERSKRLVTRDLTLETLITFLTIENNNMNNCIVTFEYRVMVTAFAILAMFPVEVTRTYYSRNRFLK